MSLSEEQDQIGFDGLCRLDKMLCGLIGLQLWARLDVERGARCGRSWLFANEGYEAEGQMTC